VIDSVNADFKAKYPKVDVKVEIQQWGDIGTKLDTAYAVDVPLVIMAPETSSRYFATDAIIARPESLTLEGAWPSCQLTEASAVALLAAVCDHL
jgi:N,N'-diacetylchitobiose transport system substrate-binding protein